MTQVTSRQGRCSTKRRNPRVALIQESLATRLRGVATVRVMEAPYDAVPLLQALWWHPAHTHDLAHFWLRETDTRSARRSPQIGQRSLSLRRGVVRSGNNG